MKDKIRVGYIGLGHRGCSMLFESFAQMTDVEIAYICDLYDDKIEKAVNFFKEDGLPVPTVTKDYREIIADDTVDAVINMTGWPEHVTITKASLLAGKYTAVEVGCAYTIKECWDLVDAHEKTGAPLMMLENCCYGRREMTALKMAKDGAFGEIVHAVGSYSHYLPDCDLFVSRGEQGYPYRVAEYINRNCEQYPTHELGPIAKILGINRGNRMMTLNSVASKSRGLSDYCERRFGDENPFKNTIFKQGDIVNTLITCANGETISLTLDTTIPRAFYSRSFSIRGTHGMCDENRRVFFLEGMEEPVENNEDEMMPKYEHPLHEEYVKEKAVGGHGGIDWLVCRAFIESVKAGTNTPIDAYDTAALMAIAPLSEESILKGGAPIEFPDFTRGKWFHREPAVKQKYSLDDVCEDNATAISEYYRKKENK